MATPTLIVHAKAGADGEVRIRLAARLARELEAVLIGIAAQEIIPPLAPTAAGAVVIAALISEEETTTEAHLNAAREAFQSITAIEGCRTEWREFIGTPADALAREARRADLIIMGRKPEDGSTGADPADVLMRSGRPVLLAPPGIDHLSLSSVLIAWKDTRESRRAVMDSIPLLRRAERVAVVAITRDGAKQAVAQTAVNDVATYLTRHDIPAFGQVRALLEPTVPAELLLAAEQHDAGLVVSGGYGHTRIQELVLGGVTRTLLRHSPRCCLLSH
jgi:nucleotide-binding universal stress UspA family protein